jgi:hypothetical protein
MPSSGRPPQDFFQALPFVPHQHNPQPQPGYWVNQAEQGLVGIMEAVVWAIALPDPLDPLDIGGEPYQLPPIAGW